MSAKFLKSMMRCSLIICVSFLCAAFAAPAVASVAVPPGTPLFPAADMDLKLAFDLDPHTLLVKDSEQCFPFFSNTEFQGKSVSCFAYLRLRRYSRLP